MKAQRLKALVVLLLVLAAAFGAHAWRPARLLADTHAKVDLEQMFPTQIRAWRVDHSGPVQLISPDQKALLNKLYNQTLSRTYVNPKGERVMLSVAYGGDQSDATTAHRPDVCYPAQGFELLSNSEARIQVGGEPMRVRHLVAQLGARVEPITYWVMVGESLALSGTEQKLAQLTYSTRGLVPDGLLVRVSSIDSNIPQAYALQQGFLSDLDAALTPELRPRLMGRSSH